MSEIENLFSLDGKTALVTGAAGLLGGKFVEALARAGAKVHAIDLTAQRLADTLQSYSPAVRENVVQVVLDITNEEQVRASIRNIADTTDSIDILVNSAAVDPKFDLNALSRGENPGEFTSYSLDNWQRSMDVNLTGAFLMSREVCKFMESQVSGIIVNISSTYGLVGPDQRIYERKASAAGGRFYKPVDYSVTKAGILGLTRALAAYYQGKGIRVNALSPGGTFNENPQEFVEHYSYRTITGRMAQPEDYAGAIIFLCSESSSYMTGANLVVDGGWTAI